MRTKYAIFVLICFLVFTLGCDKESPFSPDPALETETFTEDQSQELSKWGRHSQKVTVMTRNVYVGADLDKVIAAESPADIPLLAAEAFQMMQSTNFMERAEAFAAEVKKSQPDLIGLQEISTVFVQSPGDAIIGGTIPATHVMYDYLKILMRTLRSQGLRYKVAAKVKNFDVEVPMVVNLAGTQFDDVRLIDYDVILVKRNIETSHVLKKNYQIKLTLSDLGLEISRGFVAVDAKKGENTYRFVNTHLEPAPIPELLPIQMAQAQELVACLQERWKPVILVGDFNSPATYGETYNYLVSKGFVDIWPLNEVSGNEQGFTSPHAADLRNETVNLNQRIDLIFVNTGIKEKYELRSVQADVVGDEPQDRTPSGLWPSDHAGVVASLSITKSRFSCE